MTFFRNPRYICVNNATNAKTFRKDKATMELRKELYEKIKNHHGAINEVADRVGVSRETVRRALNGTVEKPDPAIFETAAKVILEREENKAKAVEMTENILRKAMSISVVL